MHRCLRLPVACLLISLPSGGCSSDWPRAAIEGNVLLANARPLPSGIIRFLPIDDNQGKPAFAPISDGKYKLEVHAGPAVGKNRVHITAFRKSANKIEVQDGPPGQLQEVDEQYIPVQYNVNSALVVDISATANKKDFNLSDVE